MNNNVQISKQQSLLGCISSPIFANAIFEVNRSHPSNIDINVLMREH